MFSSTVFTIQTQQQGLTCHPVVWKRGDFMQLMWRQQWLLTKTMIGILLDMFLLSMTFILLSTLAAGIAADTGRRGCAVVHNSFEGF